MKNLFWGEMEAVIKVKDNIPDENLEILKAIYPNALFIKESLRATIYTENESPLIFEELTNRISFIETTEINDEITISLDEKKLSSLDYFFNPVFSDLNLFLSEGMNETVEPKQNFALAA